jgi:alpha-glucosidase
LDSGHPGRSVVALSTLGHDAVVLSDASTVTAPWWQSGVLYQIYPRSFADTDGDGMGDIPGVIAHLDHLQWLGVDGIWLSPVTASPNADWGYDVSDFCAIQPDLGTMDDVDNLIAEANQRGIHVLLDLVPNHTSVEHPWFVESRSSLTSPKRDWYVWADPKPDGSAPNNWISSFGGSAWTPDPITGQSYLHNHLSEQPDLNWWNEEVHSAFDDIMRFWFDRGIDGFRIDVCNIIIKDALLRDNPPATEEDDFEAQMFGQRPEFNGNRPEVHEVLRRWRSLVNTYPESPVLIGETPVPVEKLAAFYGDGSDELHLAFNFPFISAAFEPDVMREIIEGTEAALPPGAWPAWTGSNHDMFRFPTRWAGDDLARTRLAALMLFTLRGTPVLYQGDEIGQQNAVLTKEVLRDPLGVSYWPYYEGRDAGRTPVQWSNAEGGGFTDPGVEPWLPLGNTADCNVEDQRDDSQSMLTLIRDLIALRRTTPSLTDGAYASLITPAGVWAWTRGKDLQVVLNMSDQEQTVSGIAGTVLLATQRERDGEHLSNPAVVAPWQGLVVSR